MRPKSPSTEPTSPPTPPVNTFHEETLVISVDPLTREAMRDFSTGMKALTNLVDHRAFPELVARIVDALNEVRRGYES